MVKGIYSSTAQTHPLDAKSNIKGMANFIITKHGAILCMTTNLITLSVLPLQNMDNIGHRSSSVVQTAFIKGLISLETFGYCLYSGKVKTVRYTQAQLLVYLNVSTRR